MRIPIAYMVAAALVLSLTATAWADIPPPPPAGLEHPPGLGPLPIAVAGLAAALAVAVGGVILARYRGGWGVRIAAWVGAAVIGTAAAVAAVSAARAWSDYDALKVQYDKELGSWHSHGPEGGPRPYREAIRAAAVFALAPQDSFPLNLPWAALVLNYPASPPDFRPVLRPSDPKPTAPAPSGDEPAPINHP